jgi:ketosteroid isomerase-like protein
VGEHPNLTTARALWDALANADPHAIRKLFSQDSVFTLRGTSPLAGSYVGTSAIMEFFAGVGEGCDDLSAELIDFSVSDHGAVIRGVVDATRGERRLKTEEFFLLRIVEGVVVSALLAPVDQAVHDAFWTD